MPSKESDLYARLQVKAETISEARLAIKKLRLRKKELRQRKKIINLEMKEMRARYRDKLSGRTGRGFLGTIRKASKQAARAERDKKLEPLQAEKLKIDDLILQIDQGILKLEGFIQEMKMEKREEEIE